MEGWIKLHRTIQEHWVWYDDKYFKWWMIILLNVNYEPKKFPVGTEIFLCEPGQSFRSINNWTALFGCSKPTTTRFFRMLENDLMIETKTVGKGNRRKHLLTVSNWNKFQQTFTENFPSTKPETLSGENPNVTPNKKEKKEKNKEYKQKFNFKSELLTLGVEPKIVSDWLEVRRKKKAANTETAFNGIKYQIEKSGLTANECIKIAVEKSWSGFNHKWLENINTSFNASDTRTQPNMEKFDGKF